MTRYPEVRLDGALIQKAQPSCCTSGPTGLESQKNSSNRTLSSAVMEQASGSWTLTEAAYKLNRVWSLVRRAINVQGFRLPLPPPDRG